MGGGQGKKLNLGFGGTAENEKEGRREKEKGLQEGRKARV